MSSVGRKQPETFEQFRSGILELLVADEPLTFILGAIVQGVEHLNPAMMCSILLLDVDGRHLGNGIACSLPEFYTTAIDRLEIGPANGSCGAAAFTGERVIVDDIASHPYWAPYKDLAARAGLASCWSQPIYSSAGHVLGTFAIYHREVCSPAASEIFIIEQSANLASIAIDKNNAADKLRNSEQRFRSFVENANDVLFALTPEGHFSYVSPQWETAFGYTIDETIGQPFLPFVHPDDVQGCITFMHTVFKTGEKQSGIEYRVLCKDGRYLWYTANGALTRDHVTGALMFIGIGRDITTRKRTEEALRKSEQHYHSLVETSQDLIWQCDIEGRYIYLNLAWEQVFGYELHEMLGRKFTDFQSLEYAERDLKEFERLVQCNSVTGYETTHIGKSGKEIHLVFNALFTCDDLGNIVGTSGTAYDITHRKKIETELRQVTAAAEAANTAKSQFLANMSHELRTPLNSIIGFTDVVLSKNFGPLNEAQQEYLGYVSQSSRHLLDLINDILDLSKIEADKMEIRLCNAIIRDLLGNCLVLVKEFAHQHGVRLIQEFGEDLPVTVRVDERKLKQICFNLLSNAIKFTPAGGSVTLSAHCGIKTADLPEAVRNKLAENSTFDRRHLKISVSDTGDGLKQGDLERIFNPFEQADNSETREFAGTGLGLALTRKLLELHGGAIWAESDGPGTGSSFHLVLPV